jgi:ribonuclease G
VRALVKEIVVNCGSRETRVAVIENGELVELYMERLQEQRIVGHIYKGKVANVLPGMQAAFVNVGLSRNTFLYVDDALENVEGVDDLPDKVGKSTAIKDVVKPGQEVIVQVSKEPFGTKGARVTRHITLPGRLVVLMPTVDYIGISRRISDPRERERLKQIVNDSRPKGMGFIVRTMAENCSEAELQKDILFLHRLWMRVRKRAKGAKAPALLHKDLTLLYRIIRDVFDSDVLRLIVDSSEEYESILSLLEDINPQLKDRVFLFQQNRPVFEIFGLETQVERALNRKVWLKCGGYLVIDHTEALTSIDVNTGKYVGSTNLADTVLKTNLEAAREIARQLRLRNIGGIIIIDFIDMDDVEHRRKVLAALEEAVVNDKTKTSILGITQLGLVEMTRQKVRQNIGEFLQKNCPTCDGTGKVITEEAASIAIETELRGYLSLSHEEAVLVEVNPLTAAMLIGVNGANLQRIQQDSGKRVYFRGSSLMPVQEYKVLMAGKNEVVEKAAAPVAVGELHTVLIEGRHHNKPEDGIARREGFVIQVENAADLQGSRVPIEIKKVFKTYARAKVLGEL